ncbi:MAG: Zn-ribbon domain-containing OB-fold protein [Planctomycetaceae bacterium]
MIRSEYSLHLDYSTPLGEVYSRFMLGLKDRRLLGNRCVNCNRLYVPARPFCDHCCDDTGELVEVEPRGRVVAFTVYNIKTANLPNPPFAQGIIKIGDAANSFLHFLAGFEFTDAEDLRRQITIGMPVRPVWATERHGGILDIAHFTHAEAVNG